MLFNFLERAFNESRDSIFIQEIQMLSGADRGVNGLGKSERPYVARSYEEREQLPVAFGAFGVNYVVRKLRRISIFVLTRQIKRGINESYTVLRQSFRNAFSAAPGKPEHADILTKISIPVFHNIPACPAARV